MNQTTQPKKRPIGIVIIAVIWTLSSIYNIYQGLKGMLFYYEFVPYSFGPLAPDWYGLVAVEFAIACAFVALGFLTFLVVFGMYKAESWSWTAAIALPLVVLVLNLIHVLMMVFAPALLELQEEARAGIVFLILSVIYLGMLFFYLTRTQVKQYFSEVPTPTSPVPVPTPPDSVASTEERKFCRYCGYGNRIDAVFCEKCGKNIG